MPALERTDGERIAALEARIARLEARQAIADLVTLYAVACDEHDMATLMDLFTEDAVFTSPSGMMMADGRHAIEEMFVNLFKVRGPAYHWTHDHIITVDADDPTTAKGRIYSHAETSPHGVTSLAAMRYDDVYRCEDGRWRFQSRDIHFLYYVPAKDFAEALTRPDRLVVGETRFPADYPEPLASWIAFETDTKAHAQNAHKGRET